MRYFTKRHWLQQVAILCSLPFLTAALLAQAAAQTLTPLEAWKSALNVKSITVIYAEQYAGNPASLFGHVFLRLDTVDTPESLASSVGFFATIPPDTHPLIYAYKGIFGGFSAHYNMSDYFRGLRDYNDLEDRGLWEYKLRASPMMIDRILNRLWSLQNSDIPYLFLSHNCASGLFELFHAADPAFPLAGGVGIYVLPIELPRALARQGMIESIKYRPSLSARVNALHSQLSAPQRETLETLIDGTLSPTLVQDREVLHTAAEYLTYRDEQGHRDGAEQDSDNLNTRILAQRARLGGRPAPSQAAPVELVSPPHRAHPPSQLATFMGRNDGETSLSLRFRPGVHGLLDRSDGLLKYSEMEVISTEMQYDVQSRLLLIDDVRILSLRNIVPLSFATHKPSWGLTIAAHQSANSCRVLAFQSEAGLATGGPPITPYVLVAARAEGGACIDREARLGPALSAGAIIDPGPLKLNFFVYRFHSYLAEYDEAFATLDAALYLGQTLTLYTALSRNLGLMKTGGRIGLGADF